MLTYRQDGEKWRDTMKWYTMELTRIEWTSIRPTLKELECTIEASGIDAEWVHVEIYCTPDVAGIINDKIDEL